MDYRILSVYPSPPSNKLPLSNKPPFYEEEIY